MRRSAQGWQRASHKRVKSAVYRFSLPHSSNLVNPSLLSNCGYSLSTQYIPFLRELIINSKLFQCFMAKYGQQHRDTIPHPHSIAFRHGPIKQKLHMMRAATASPLSFGQKAVSWTQSPAKKLQDCQCCNPAKYAANTQWWDQVLRLWFLDLTMTGQMARVGA